MAGSTVTIDEALAIYDKWLLDPRLEFRHEPTDIDRLLRATLEPLRQQQAPKAIADCYLAAFAESSGLGIVTFDKALAQLAKHRRIDVELLSPE